MEKEKQIKELVEKMKINPSFCSQFYVSLINKVKFYRRFLFKLYIEKGEVKKAEKEWKKADNETKLKWVGLTVLKGNKRRKVIDDVSYIYMTLKNTKSLKETKRIFEEHIEEQHKIENGKKRILSINY